MVSILWGTPTAQTEVIANAALASNATGTLTVGSTPVDNSTSTLYTHAIIEIELGSINPTGTPYIEVYAYYAVDGTNYEDQSVALSHALVAAVPVTTGTSAKEVATRPFLIMPFLFKVAIRNQTGVTLAATANSIKITRLFLAST